MASVPKRADRITYSRLDQALAALGFVRKKTKDFTAYSEREHGALIVLPHMSADSEVGDPHLVTVRNTVIGRGVSSFDRFQTLLVGLPVKPAAHAKPRKPSLRAYYQQSAQVEKAPKKSALKKHPSPASGG